jgi:hypothetical protein
LVTHFIYTARRIHCPEHGVVAGGADWQPAESVHAADGVQARPSQLSHQIAAELFIPDGASGGKRPATHAQTGGEG